MNRKLTLLVFLIFFSHIFFTSPVKSNPDGIPSAAAMGRYILQEDKYWIVYNMTLQQLIDQGYDVPGDPSWLVQVNYTRLDYTMQCKIVRFSWPNVTLENIEGEYDLNVTVHKIIDGSIGEKLASFLKANQPARIAQTWSSWDPYLGVMFNPSIFTIGYNFSIGNLKYNVNKTEVLTDTPWGENDTYVLHGYLTDPPYYYENMVWCDATSGIVLKETWDSNVSMFISHEEMRIIETGIEEIAGVKVGDWVAYGDCTVEWDSNIPGQEKPPQELNFSWTDLEVLDVLGSNVTARSTTIYKNGTEQTTTSWVGIATGEGAFALNIIPSNLSSGDEIPANIAWFTSEPLTLTINDTITSKYANANREVNYANSTSPVMSGNASYGTLNMSMYWDKKTGVLCELEMRCALSIPLNDTFNYYLNMSFSAKITATTIWQAVFTVKNGYTFDVTIIANSTISDFNFNESLKQISFNVTGPTGKVGYCNVSIPDGLLWGEFSVYKNGFLLTKDVDYTQTYNGTHFIFRITYTHSSHNIVIRGTYAIPEFPSLIMLPLFIIATLFAVMVYRKRIGTLISKEHQF